MRRAIEFFEQHLVLARELGDRQGEARASWNQGAALVQQGEMERAAGLMQSYVDYLCAISHRDVEAYAGQLARLRSGMTTGADGATITG